MAKQRTDTESVLKLVVDNQQAKTSAKELQDSYRKLTAELNNMKRADNPALYAEKARSVQLLKKSLTDAKKEVNGVTEESKKFHSSWKDIAGGMVAGFGISAGIGMLKGFGQQVFDTTAKFQKMEAVLTTTLGSNSQAKLVMQQIQDFASKTPFQVDELTDSYVRLANQGFRPTMEQLRSLGDLSASTGKDFTQLTEAIIDAQTGEFERLKEFGIRASKQGDQVQFTFKGVTKEVAFTADTIREYITELGNAEGVSGSMSAISETLGGKVSNLNDSWDALLKTVGEETEGVFSASLDIMGEALSRLNEYTRNLNIAQKYNAPGTGFKDRITEIASAVTPGGINIQALQRKTFSDLSAGFDQRIGDAKYMRELLDVQSDLVQRMKRVDRTTREGASAYDLYADKLKMVKERSTDILNDRKTEKLKDEAAATKKAAEETEKAGKVAEKEAERRKKEREKDIESIKAAFNKEMAAMDLSKLEGLDKVIAEINAKYAPLIENAKKLGLTDLVKGFEGLRDSSVTAAKNADQEKKDAEASGREADDMLSVVTSMDQLGMSETDKEVAAVDEKYSLLKEKAEEFGFDVTEIERYWQEERQKILTDAAKAEEEKNREKNQKIYEDDLALKQGRLQVAASVADALISIIDVVSNNESEFLGFKKAIILAQLAIDTASAISSVTAKNAASSLTPIDFAIKVAASVATVMANILAAKNALKSAPEVKKPAYQHYQDGGVVDGPRHSEGGIKLVDGITGQLIGEMEGGERILSRRDTQRVDDMLYGGQRMSGMSVNASGILEADRTLRYGVTAQGEVRASGEAGSNNTTVNNFDTRTLEEKMDQFIEAANNAWNYRLFEKKKERYDGVRADLDA